MATLEITSQNFKEVVDRDGIIILDWWASWCGPCKAFSPIFDQASEKHTDVTFGKINTEEQQELSGAFEIRSIPTLMIFRDRVLLFSQPGAVPATGLEDLIRQAKALDMDDVRRQIEERERAQRN